MKTDDLIEEVIKEGVPLPTYDYARQQFRIEIPVHFPIKSGGNLDYCDTFREALETILKILR